MSIRIKISVLLVVVGILLAFLPAPGNIRMTASPDVVLNDILNSKTEITADNVARLIADDDSTFQLIDVRSAEEFRKLSIPGAVNIPYNSLFRSNASVLFNNGKTYNIFYSNDDIEAGLALVLTRGMKLKNTYIMKGGLNEWFRTVMNSTFSGDRISARENALFEARAKSKRLFAELNSMPDSLKLRFMDAKRMSVKKLDGGCE